MLRSSLLKATAHAALFCFFLSISFAPATLHAQTDLDVVGLKQKAGELIKEQKFTEALPLLEKLVAAEPDDFENRFYLGFALLAQANATKDEARRKTLRIRARAAFVKSKELGNEAKLVDALIQSLAPDGSEGSAFSSNAEAHKLMREAESLFGQGKLDDALRNYQKALQLDPMIYEAALFSGDVFVHKGDYQQAETWYQKAIAIDPYRETAYRYSATPFMKQRKYSEARDRYVEAYISEPFNRFSHSGLTQWAQITNTRLAHPAIDIPTNVTFDEKGNAKVNLSADALLGGKDDGSIAWISYGTTRSKWRKEKFAKTFPAEKTYRHSLAEEADALRSVISLVGANQKVNLNPSLAKLKKLNDDGLLEPYILLVHVDEGIAQDYLSYLKQHRDKLRRYVVEYLLTGGGKL
jgi:tetratricopeptide (TPR) repeat protein